MPERPEYDETLNAWFESEGSKIVSEICVKDETKQLRRVALLKHLESIAASAFQQYMANISGMDDAKQQLVLRVVFQSNFTGIKDGSDLFWEVLRFKCLSQSVCRRLIARVLENCSRSGFTAFEKALIVHSSHISNSYDAYYLSWLKAVQDPIFAASIKDSDSAQTKQNREKVGEEIFLSPYTVVRACQSKEGYDFLVEPYATFFAKTLQPVLRSFQAAVNELSACEDENKDTNNAAMIAYLDQYRIALAETDLQMLEKQWTLCDRMWMNTKSTIQIVHDIEDGYSDPMRAKQGPDFSLRLLDDTYDSQNLTIQKIHALICKYYTSRKTKLSADGLTALGNTIAGIYYIPFKTGCSLVFSYSGQSIPNRLDVKTEKGVKIYFDAIETMARVEQVKEKVMIIYADARKSVIDKFKPDAVDQLVWHVAAHEVGHAIYGIRSIEKYIRKESIMMLEEPRAELTAMFTLRLLFQEKMLSYEELQKHVTHFCLDGVRYFMKFHTISLQPYIVFQIHAHNVYFREGFLSLDEDGKVVIDASKTLKVLDSFSSLFEEILDALDLGNEEGGQKLERILELMERPSDQTNKVIQNCLTN